MNLEERKQMWLKHTRTSRRLARQRDPDTSHMAAAEIVATSIEKMRDRAFRLLQNFPGKTAKELEDRGGYTDGQIRKRLNDLRIHGLARKGVKRECSITGKMAYAWYPSS